MLHQDQAAAAGPSGRLTRFATRIDVTAVIVALLLAGFFVVGASFAATNSSAWFSGSAGAAIGAFLAVLVIAAALYLAIRLLYRWLDRRWDATAESAAGIIPMRKALRRWFWPSFAAVYAGWLGWLLIHFPGSVDSDTITQLYQWLGLAAKVDHHPWFDTMIFGWFFDLGRAVGNWNVGLFAFLFVQVTASAAGMALALTYLARLGLSKGPRRVLTAFVAVFPIFAMSVSVMSKDSFGQVFWLPFVVMYVEALRTRGRFLCRPWIGLAAIVLTIPLVLAKRTNVYVVVLCLIVLLVVSAWRTAARLAIGAVVVVAVTNLLWPHVVLPALGVAPGTGTDALTVPLQQTARTVREHGANLPASERAAIDAVLRYQGLAKAYDPRRSDAVKGRWRAGTTSAERRAYLRTWLAEGLRYPGTYLAATANNTYEYFAPLTPMSFQTDLDLRRYIDFWQSRAFPSTTRAQITDVALGLHPPATLVPVRSTVNHVNATFLTGNLFASKALYASWIPLLVLGFAIRRRSWLLALATIPLFLNLAVLVASPIALPRYIGPSVHGAVLIAGLAMLPLRWQPRREIPADPTH